MKTLNKTLITMIFLSFYIIKLFANDWVIKNDDLEITPYNKTDNRQEQMNEAKAKNDINEIIKLLDVTFSEKISFEGAWSPILQKTIANIHNLAIYHNTINSIKSFTDDNINSNIDLNGLKKFIKRYNQPSNILKKFYDFIYLNIFLRTHYIHEKEILKDQSFSGNIKIDKYGYILITTIDENGEKNQLCVNEAIHELSLFLEKYEFVFDSCNPYLILMNDKELENYKHKSQEAILEFSQYDFSKAYAEFSYAMKRFSIGLINNPSKGKEFISSLRNQFFENENLFFANNQHIMEIEYVFFLLLLEQIEEEFSEKKCPLMKKIKSKNSDLGFITSLWKQYEYDEYYQPISINSDAILIKTEVLKKHFCDNKNTLKESMKYAGIDILTDRKDEWTCYKSQSEACDKLIEDYCKLIDPSDELLRINAFWKVWGPICASGQDPWSYWFSQLFE